jgi:hypothetical protein
MRPTGAPGWIPASEFCGNVATSTPFGPALNDSAAA